MKKKTTYFDEIVYYKLLEAEQEAGENKDVAKVIQSRDDNIFHHISHPLKALSA